MRNLLMFFVLCALLPNPVFAQQSESTSKSLEEFKEKKQSKLKPASPLREGDVVAMNKFICKQINSSSNAVLSFRVISGEEYWYDGPTDEMTESRMVKSSASLIVEGTKSYSTRKGDPGTRKRVRVATRNEVLAHAMASDAVSSSWEMTTAVKDYKAAIAKTKRDVRLKNKEVVLQKAEIIGFFGSDKNKKMKGNESDFVVYRRKQELVAVKLSDLYATSKREAFKAQAVFLDIQQATGVGLAEARGLDEFEPKEKLVGEIVVFTSTRTKRGNR